MRRRVSVTIIFKLKEEAPLLSSDAYRHSRDFLAATLADYPFRTSAPLSSPMSCFFGRQNRI